MFSDNLTQKIAEAAKKIMDEKPASIELSISKAYEAATGKIPNAAKIQTLKILYIASYKNISSQPEKTSQLIADSTIKKNKQLAAMAITTSAILNLDEVITKN